MKHKVFIDDTESVNRSAWTQTISQGMGNGLEAYKHKQVDSCLKLNYYVKTKGEK